MLVDCVVHFLTLKANSSVYVIFFSTWVIFLWHTYTYILHVRKFILFIVPILSYSNFNIMINLKSLIDNIFFIFFFFCIIYRKYLVEYTHIFMSRFLFLSFFFLSEGKYYKKKLTRKFIIYNEAITHVKRTK